MPTKPKTAKAAAIVDADDFTVVDADEEVGPGSDDTFVHETPYGTIEISSLAVGPNPKPYALARARANKDMMTMTVLMVRAKAGDNASQVEDILEKLDEDQFEDFFNGWNKFSGVTQGE